MAQGWDTDSVADTITFYQPPANAAAIVVTQYASTTFRATPVWAFGAWSDALGWPSEVEYLSDRLVFAGSPSQPAAMWMTRIGDYTNFGKSVPVADDDAITVTLNARNVNQIREIVPLDNPLIMTSAAEWRLTAGQDDVLTPSTVGFKPQTYNGIGSLPAVVVGNVALYVQDRGFVVRDLAYQFDVDGYTGNNVTVFSAHLVEGYQLVDLTFQQVPYSIVWFVRDDGTLLSMTYVRE
ncbi:MAG TPA: hypothetical protein VJ724_05695, partial [Tahibacter sp.]|nr:hypothetical protein [Tahibacter sp.]